MNFKFRINNCGNCRGFTLVELMIVVSIIGILAATSSVFFDYYRSKSKSTEAKLVLSSIYTSEQMFYNAFDMYANCLDDMGFEISKSPNRHYAVGFPSITANIDPDVYANAIKNGLGMGLCNNLGPVENSTYYLATSGAASFLVNTVAEFAGAITASSNNLDEGGTTETDVTEGLGDQSEPSRKLFTAAAFGYINAEFVSPANGSLWTISSSKLIKQHRKGF